MAEYKVGKLSEIPEEGGKEYVIEGAKVLVGRTNGELFAIGGTCPHYGAPLATGSIMNGTVKCPWHGACFSTKTGDIEDLPGLDSVQCYKVRVDGDDLVVTAEKEQLSTPKRKRNMARLDAKKDSRVFVVVGGGAAGSAAVEAIRIAGFEGRLVWFIKEGTLPIDRIRLSKSFSLEASSIQLRPSEFYNDINLEVHLGAAVTDIDHDARTLQFTSAPPDASTHSLSYDSILVATGGSPIPLKLDGAHSENVFLLRTLADSTHIGQAVSANPHAKVVVVGSNFIGMECAASLSKMVESVTVISRGGVPFKPFGPEIGASMLRLFEKNNVKFRPNAEPKELKVKDGKVVGVVCADGAELPCDLLVCGVGVEIKSSTSFIRGTGIVIEPNGAIQVDENLRAAPGFFAAGDIVKYPDPLFGRIRIEHWGIAGSMGNNAGHNIVAENSKKGLKFEPYDAVPFFWTLNFGKGIRYVGHADRWDEIFFDMEPNGLDVDSIKFVAYFIKDNQVAAVATVGRDPMAARCSDFMKWKKMPSVEAIKAAFKEKGSTNHLFF